MTNETRYKHKQFLARMKYNTYLRIKKEFPVMKGESMTSYFERLAKHLETNDLKLAGFNSINPPHQKPSVASRGTHNQKIK